MNNVKVSDVIIRANTKEDRNNTDRIYYCAGEQIDSEELLIRNKGIIAEADLGPMFYFGFKSGQLLLPTRSFESRKAAIATYDGICSEKTFVLESKNTDVLLNEYLIIIFQKEEFWQYCEDNKSGSVNFFLNWSTIADYEFSLPPLTEQKALADKLWAAYRLKESYKKLLAATDEMVKAQFVEMFNFSSISECNAKLSDYATVSGGYAFKSELFQKEGIPIIRISNINDGDVVADKEVCYSESFWIDNEAFRIQQNDILMAMSGATTGKIGIYKSTDKLLINQRVALIRSIENKSTSLFLYSALQSDLIYKEIQKRAQGGAQPNISGKQIESLPLPTVQYSSQLAFEKIKRQAEQSKAELRKSIEAIDGVIKSLING